MIIQLFLISALACSKPEVSTHSQKESEGSSISDLFESELKTLGAEDTQDIIGGKVGLYSFDESTWALAFQYFKQKQIVYMSVNRYLNIDSAQSSSASVLTLTQIATLNHELHGVKLQLNPDNGAITMSSEMDIIDDVDPLLLHQKAIHLLETAKNQRSKLHAALHMGQY